MWAVLLVLIGGAALIIGYLGSRTFSRRVLNEVPRALPPRTPAAGGPRGSAPEFRPRGNCC
jgi:hypothetical protein